ncbi:hypothetical protein PAXINDRAFT_104010 [Paxillus involutus ATCC 200175]|uniref:Vps72/YL1 C-terminal domain-containing protein n=1 Tax=Paxillus involutus ATCC 200175 TaxID=664439 RepID=A0A0C9SLP9_PAXIN|nr:hypothetical protein PAXINDRAFT_104010 [Paxillus involutus ATCC 200175]
MAEEDSLVSRRPKRSTAGNRMELALAELTIEENAEAEDDVDFVDDKEEEDVFESDFASTDEEAARDDVDEGDGAVREEEVRERKTARARVEKATAAAHARQRVTFNPEGVSSQSKRKATQKTKRRVSLGVAVNAETGEVIEGSGTIGVKRHSQRRHTIMNTSATVNRMKDAEEKKASIPKKIKTITRLPTQDELIARALDAEEGNIIEHRDYLRLEEEKRARARVVRQSIDGPVLRWISRKETVKVGVKPPLPTPAPAVPAIPAVPAQTYAARYSFVYGPGVAFGSGMRGGVATGATGSQAYSMPFYPYIPPIAQSATPNTQDPPSSAKTTGSPVPPQPPPVDASVTSTSAPPTDAASASLPIPFVPPTPTGLTPSPNVPSPQMPAPVAPPVPPAQPQLVPIPIPVPAAPPVEYRTEDVCRNYVIHALSRSAPAKPLWKDTMSAMFGNHVRWEELKVFTGRGRPLARPTRTCPITGLPGKYLDPRTNVPFANVGAYEMLTRILKHEFVWCEALGCYVDVGAGVGGVGGQEGTGGGQGRAETDEGAGGEDEGEDEDLEGRAPKRRKVGVEGE